MYKQRISYADYVEEVERLYKIERREIYFGGKSSRSRYD